MLKTGLRFLSVCSGIEAASCSWNPLGWKAVAFSEIEPFPCALLAHHYPDTPNWGDMTKYEEWPDVSIDLLCGGTPCQSFSVAGLREGLADPRGNLMLTFGAIAAKYRPQWLVWENVPGVLSSNEGRDFASFLGLITGQEVQVPAGGWQNSGIVAGIPEAYGAAYRVLDAQYFGVAQRRRRVFVVGCLGDWHSAAAVLFERHSVSGHPAPRRQAGQAVAGTLSARTEGGGGLGADFDCSGGVQVAGTMKACKDSGGWSNSADRAAAGYMIPVATLCVATGQAGAEIGAEIAPTLNCNHEAPYAVYATVDVSPTLCAGGNKTGGDRPPGTDVDTCETLIPVTTHTLRGEGFDASEDGTGRGTPLVPVLPFDTTQVTSAANRSNPQVGDPCHPLAAGAHAPAIAFNMHKSGNEASSLGISEDRTDCLRAFEKSPFAVQPAMGMQVRRLTPMECERLQGFPDGYTDVPHRKKPAADGPRYKALGNSWAVPNVRWIGKRIEAVALINTAQPAMNNVAETEEV